MQLYSSLSIFCHCLSLGLEWILIFSSPMATAEFSKFAGILSAALSQHHLSGFEIAQLEFHHSYEVMGLDALILVFWMLSFKTTFSLSSFTFIKRLLSSSLSAISWLEIHKYEKTKVFFVFCPVRRYRRRKTLFLQSYQEVQSPHFIVSWLSYTGSKRI